jgi:hypothetical protein
VKKRGGGEKLPYFIALDWVNEQCSLLFVNTVHSQKLFGYSNEAAESDFCVFSKNCLIKIIFGETAKNAIWQ